MTLVFLATITWIITIFVIRLPLWRIFKLKFPFPCFKPLFPVVLYFHPSQHQPRSSFPTTCGWGGLPATSHKPASPSCSIITLFGIQGLPSNSSHPWGRSQEGAGWLFLPHNQAGSMHNKFLLWADLQGSPEGQVLTRDLQLGRECAASAKRAEKPKKKCWREELTSVFQIM